VEYIPNLLLIAGTGTKSGKTSMACKVIEEFAWMPVTAVKISPHFHESTAGLISKSESKGYSIYEETQNNSSKDSSRMLSAGAERVYFAKVWDDQVAEVFNKIMEYVPANAPIVCESPALRNFVEPGLFIIMTSNSVDRMKNINHLQALPHVMFKLEELKYSDILPIRFEGGKWFYRV
jgi:hypothetical protein